jgi:hypothetical protein
MEGETHEQRLAVLAGLHGGDKGGLVERIKVPLKCPSRSPPM